jgi:predicted Zn-dependent protease
MKPQKRTLGVLAFIAIMVLSTCARNPVTGKRQFVLMSERQEIAMGAEYDPQIVASFGLYENTALQAFVDQRGREMGLISHRPALEYHIRLLDSPVINAFAVPGGYIYLTRGILTHFNNEAELIGVLAHEMGHITARHTVSRQAKQTLGQIAVIGGMIASEEFRKYGEVAMAGMQLIFLQFSRDDEREADRLGVEYTAKIGYDASRFADFFRLLVRMNLESQQAGIPTFLSTHPDPGDRYNTVKQDAELWKDSLNLATWKVNDDPYLQMIDGMVYGEDPRQGFVEGNTFYHPELKFRFSFPAGWKLENSPMQVRMAPEDGKALIIFSFARGNTLQEAAQNSLAQLELNVLESNNTTVNGMPALAVLSEQSQQNPNTGQVQTLRVRSYYIDDNNTYYVFHGVSPLETFGNYLSPFNSTMQGFARLTDPSKINVKPRRIQVKRVQQAGTLADAFRYHGVPQTEMEEFSFLNNMELTDRVAVGKLIKVVGE